MSDEKKPILNDNNAAHQAQLLNIIVKHVSMLDMKVLQQMSMIE